MRMDIDLLCYMAIVDGVVREDVTLDGRRKGCLFDVTGVRFFCEWVEEDLEERDIRY